MFGIPIALVAALASYGTTGKGITDNVASFVTQEDCALHYILPEGSYCKSSVEKEVKKHITIITAIEKEQKAIEDFKASIKW